MPDPLPKGSRLLHIGPAKTGTTSLQSAFHHSRGIAEEHGVHYAGAGRQPWYAASASLGLSPAVRDRDMKPWEALVAEVQGSGADRVVISSEAFAHADAHAADGILEAFGRDRTRVVITMRPLADMLSSSWWQFVQGGVTIPYDEWLQGVLVDDREGERITKGFWRRSRIDVLAERWADRVGAENVTVISLADRPRDFVVRTFEELTALPSGILVPQEGESNTTLPYPMLELGRHFNEVVKSQGAKGQRRVHVTRMRAFNMVKRHSDLLTDMTRIDTPAWAVEEAGKIAAEMNDRVRALGVNVIGDLDALTRPSRTAPESVAPAPTSVPIEDAAAVMYFTMLATEGRTRLNMTREFEKRQARQALRRAQNAPPRPEDLGGRELVRLLGSRVKRRITRR
ncbi:MAG: hypothetical protein NTX33_02815 [Propionibacteriales bacterium]|nr:hypothetical protein [Propionibacteriales bacterium]